MDGHLDGADLALDAVEERDDPLLLARVDAEGELLWTATRSNAGDAATEVGGARYQWITAVNGSFNFDNQSLERVEVKPVDQCGDNAWEAQDFKNQGQCIRYVNTGK